MAEIVSAVREQTKAATHVVGLMERVRGGVEQISNAGAEQDRGQDVEVFGGDVHCSTPLFSGQPRDSCFSPAEPGRWRLARAITAIIVASRRIEAASKGSM